MSPEQEAEQALRLGIPRSELSPEGRAAYDRLRAQRFASFEPAPYRDGDVERVPMAPWVITLATWSSFLLGPGIVAVWIPWLITRWNAGGPYASEVSVVGTILIVAGALGLIATFWRFPTEGNGTPFPTDPPSCTKVIVGGPYRYVRNPMYDGYLVIIFGEALVLARPVLFIYDASLFVVLLAFVRLYEEWTMKKRFGGLYDAYCGRVPRWWPKIPQRPR